MWAELFIYPWKEQEDRTKGGIRNMDIIFGLQPNCCWEMFEGTKRCDTQNIKIKHHEPNTKPGVNVCAPE
jgi:hypothetical protein